MTTNETNPIEIGEDLTFARDSRRTRAMRKQGWVEGTLNGHKFQAKVFPEHCDVESWELNHSKIAKLHVRRLSDNKEVFNFDRGADVPAENALVQAIVEFLCAGLADHLYGE